MITANRSHKLMVRVQKIESTLPPLEKAVLAQTSHVHFAYTAGIYICIYIFFFWPVISSYSIEDFLEILYLWMQNIIFPF